jgi:hypothetical protein
MSVVPQFVAHPPCCAQRFALARTILIAALLAFAIMQVWVNRLQIQINDALIQRIRAMEKMR